MVEPLAIGRRAWIPGGGEGAGKPLWGISSLFFHSDVPCAFVDIIEEGLVHLITAKKAGVWKEGETRHPRESLGFQDAFLVGEAEGEPNLSCLQLVPPGRTWDHTIQFSQLPLRFPFRLLGLAVFHFIGIQGSFP